MGGATSQEPVVDDDAIWIGSSQGGNAGNSYRGSLDSLAIHRVKLDDATMKSRYRRVGEAEKKIKPAPEVMPDFGTIPVGQVVFHLLEPMPTHDRWLNEDEKWPAIADEWLGDAFLLPRLPIKYDDWGIRQGRTEPTLLRIAADVTLEPGPRQFMLRAQSLSRLWVDGQIIARTKPITGSPSGEELITPVAESPRKGLRHARHRQQEVVGEAVIGPSGTCRVVLEVIVGGKKFRVETGELCVGVATSDNTSIDLLQPFTASQPPQPITDTYIESKLEAIEATLKAKDDLARRKAAGSQDDYWNQRHELARQRIEDQQTHLSIDTLIEDKIQRTLQQASETDPGVAEHFRGRILPILSEHCFRCHGDKDNGGLKLNSREAFLKGGDSETPAFVPGDAGASEAMARIQSDDDSIRMPPTGDPLTREQIKVLEDWVNAGAVWAGPLIEKSEVALAPIIDDASFLRRVTLDSIGLPPTEVEIREFLRDGAPDKRPKAIDRLLADDRWADHWVSYWQDVLAENPTLINMSLNSTGPFRLFLWDAFRDNKPIDRWVTELILMRGGAFEGGSAGFGLAGDNDAPLATKGQILASAFLGIELQCARCHDSPYHSTKQKDLYSLAAMLDRKTITVPKSSMVPAAFFEKQARQSLIKATLKPDESIEPIWPFEEMTGPVDSDAIQSYLRNPKDSREQLAALITGPQNKRFPRIIANRIWRRLIGAGIVEPPQDWEGKSASHPELLDGLALELVRSGYDVKHLMRLIMNSQLYQRAANGYNLSADPEVRFFSAPDRRRLTAEQIVDSMYAAAGMEIDIEPLTFDPDGRRPASNRISLGKAHRAWMLVSLNNERDRPSLTLPRAQALDDVMTAFGWSGSRQMPRTDRETSPNVLQPGALANGTLSSWLTSASNGSGLSQLAIEARSPEQLVDSLFLRYLGRVPIASESAHFVKQLTPGFDRRIERSDQVQLLNLFLNCLK